ncbi:T9SS type A sorting domain-containing protein [Psychroserpens luteolus]|uniref:T9SS type A sorting domain-containing protein n=1 Tax=Psychroserpens luteolus TaxID=2855840 RepID=UPI001E312A03|nr:T9SS type A sorting domain-containing protein [Psychroserpens luteolus]MCD2259590.1 T9SS type A sorting domain-containing protein [Psychroserpens luteolus]
MKTNTILSLLFLIGTCSALAQVNLGQIDDFENGTTENWTDGGSSVPPVNISSGGPTGANDNYLSDPSLGGGGEGSKMVMFNEQQWAGNYTSTGIISIKFDARAITNTLNLRIAFDGAGGRICTINAVTIPAGGSWQQYTIPILASDFTTVAGGSNVAQTLSDVSTMRILSNTNPSWQGESISAILEIDNIEASATLSVEDFSATQLFEIIPNVSEDKLNLTIPDFSINNSTILDIFDSSGRQVLNKKISSLQNEISVIDWNNGIYFVRIISDNSQQVKKFIKI